MFAIFVWGRDTLEVISFTSKWRFLLGDFVWGGFGFYILGGGLKKRGSNKTARAFLFWRCFNYKSPKQGLNLSRS